MPTDPEAQRFAAEDMLRQAIRWYVQNGRNANSIIDLAMKIGAEEREHEYARDDTWEPAPE